MADLQVTNELCKEAYATWRTKDERAEFNQECKNFDATKNQFNNVLSEMSNAKDQKKKDALYSKLMALQEEIRQREINVELRNKKLEQETLEAKHKFQNMTPVEKSMAAKNMRDSGFTKSALITEDMQKAIEVFAERNLDAQLAQTRAEEALGKKVGEKDTLVMASEEERKVNERKSLKPKQADIEKKQKEREEFVREIRRVVT